MVSLGDPRSMVIDPTALNADQVRSTQHVAEIVGFCRRFNEIDSRRRIESSTGDEDDGDERHDGVGCACALSLSDRLPRSHRRTSSLRQREREREAMSRHRETQRLSRDQDCSFLFVLSLLVVRSFVCSFAVEPFEERR